MTQAFIGVLGFVISVFVVGFLPGLLLLIAGRRGRRIDDHPVCRGCGFDLFGTREPIPDKHPKCPECGTRREPRVGNRQRRGKLALAGVLLMLTSLGVAGVWGYGQFGAAQIASIKPMWLLRFEARSGTSNTADIALGEMIARFQNGNLTAATAELLLDDAVAHGPAGNPALVNASLGSRWDELAAELMLAGHGTDAEREAIAKSWVTVSLEVRPEARLWQDVPVRIKRKQFGPPRSISWQPYVQRGGRTIRMVDFEHTNSSSGSSSLSANRGSGGGRGSLTMGLRPGHDLPNGLGLGEHEFELEQPLAITNGHNGPRLVEWTERLIGKFEIVAPDGDPVTLRHDPTMAVTVEQGTTVVNNEIKVRRWGSDTNLNFEGITGPIAYRLFLQRGDKRWPHATISTYLSGSHGYGTGGDVSDELEDGAVVDLVFVPDADAARKTPDLVEILDHTFTIPGVKIIRPVAASP